MKQQNSKGVPMRHSAIAIAVAALSLGVALPAAATNGYFAHGYGAQSKAMAGVGVAMSLDGLTPATNPAGLVGVEDGLDVGISYFSPDRGYDVSGGPSGACMSAQQCTFGVGPGSLRSSRDYFLIPNIGWVHRLDEQSVIGIAVYGNGGMNTRYVGGSATFGAPVGTVPPGTAVTYPGTFGGGTAGVDLMQLFIAPTYARGFGNGASFGISPVIAMQLFEARGLGSFAPFSSDPNNLTDNGHDTAYGFGLKLGVQVPMGDSAKFGASYQSKMSMGKFDNYAGLFEGGGSFDIPATATVGVAVQPSDKWTMGVDVQWIGYGGVDAIANPMFPNLMTAPLGADGGPGFGWDDMTVYKFGGSVKTSDRGKLHFGYSKTSQPVPSSEVLFNILAPGVVEQHFTVGYTQLTESGNRWTLSGMYAPSKKVRGVNPLDPAQTIELSMNQFDIEFSYHFGH